MRGDPEHVRAYVPHRMVAPLPPLDCDWETGRHSSDQRVVVAKNCAVQSCSWGKEHQGPQESLQLGIESGIVAVERDAGKVKVVQVLRSPTGCSGNIFERRELFE
jgi:hypothetical protein